MSRYMQQLDREARDDNRRAAEVLASSGVKSVPVNGTDVEGWRQTIEGLHPKLRAQADFDAAMFDELLGLLAEHRRANP
jgi:hypothetical protein